MPRKTLRWPFRKDKDLPVELGFDQDEGLHFAQELDGSKRVYVSDRKRLKLYHQGLTHRQEWILSDYRLPIDLVSGGDVVVDVGANIGEIGRWVEAAGGAYVAFEPDPNAFNALRKNVVSEKLFQIALSDKAGSAEFYLNTAEADSSLFQPSESSETIIVDVVRLDDLLSDIGNPERIKLLKIEAEGMEPEILRGAQAILKKVEYLAVDAGPERGGENTVPGVFKAIEGLGFEVIDCFLRRGTFLFVRK